MSILQKFNEGGLFMYFILAFGLLSLSLILERAVTLYSKIKTPPKSFRDQILDFLRRGDFKAAESFANTAGDNTGLGRVVALGFL